MSLVHLAHLSSHIKNCCNLNLAATAIPFSRFHLTMAFALYKEGFISSVQKGSTAGPDLVPVDVTPDNISSRRLWLSLKYRNNLPVIRDFSLISKPSRRVMFSSTEIKALASGMPVRVVKPLQPAECIFIRHKNDVVEVQEAAKRDIGGEVLCRIK